MYIECIYEQKRGQSTKGVADESSRPCWGIRCQGNHITVLKLMTVLSLVYNGINKSVTMRNPLLTELTMTYTNDKTEQRERERDSKEVTRFNHTKHRITRAILRVVLRSNFTNVNEP
jgi:hypothetical protein